jgi:hypothetical protein
MSILGAIVTELNISQTLILDRVTQFVTEWLDMTGLSKMVEEFPVQEAITPTHTQK